MANRFDIETFGRAPESVARVARAEDVFSFLNREVSVPASCVALVWGESAQPTVVPAGRPIEAGGTREVMLVRTTPFVIDYEIDGLVSKDDYPFSACVKLSIQVVPDRAELGAFRTALVGSSNEVQMDHLRQHCEDAVRTALAAFAKGRDAAELVSPESWSAFDDVVAGRFKPVGFASGLALGPDPRVTFESPAYAESRRADEAAVRRRKRLETDGQLRDISAKARAKHLEELGTLLKQARRMAGEQPGVAVADLIKSFDPAQRGALYEGLATLQQPACRTEAILVVAGDELLRFDPTDPGRPSRRYRLTSGAGPLRSIRPANDGSKQTLLVGARRGVHLVDPEDGLRQTCTFDTQTEPRGGVNAAVLLGDHLYATHSEIGLIRWNRCQPNDHTLCLADVTRGAKAIRDVQADETGRLWLSVDDRVVGWTPDKETPPTLLSAPAVVTALLVADGFAWAGLDDGGVVRWPIADPAEMETLRGPSGNAVGSLDWTRGGGVPRLLIADGRPHLDLQVLGDAYVGEYRCEHKLRWGLGAEDWIIGVNDRRDRVFAWRLDSPQQPTTTIPVGRILGHSVQDIALLPARAGTE